MEIVTLISPEKADLKNYKCMEGQLSEQSIKILLSVSRTSQTIQLPKVCRMTSNRDIWPKDLEIQRKVFLAKVHSLPEKELSWYLSGSPQRAHREYRRKVCSTLEGIAFLFHGNFPLNLVTVRILTNLPVFCSHVPDGIPLTVYSSSLHSTEEFCWVRISKQVQGLDPYVVLGFLVRRCIRQPIGCVQSQLWENII